MGQFQSLYLIDSQLKGCINLTIYCTSIQSKNSLLC